MNAPMLIVLLVSLWSLGNSAKTPTNSDIACTQPQLKDIDGAIARIVSFTKIQRPFADKKSLIQPWCTEAKKDLTTAENIAFKCLQGPAKTYSKILAYSMGGLLKTICNPRNKKKQNDLAYLNKCMNNEKAIPIMHQQFVIYIDMLRKGAVAKPAKNRIGYVCCSYFKLLENVEQNLKGVCTEKQITATVELVRNLLQSIVDVACGDFTADSDSCDKLPPPPAKKINSVLPESISFFIPFIELLANLDK